MVKRDGLRPPAPCHIFSIGGTRGRTARSKAFSGDFNPQVIHASVLRQMGRIDEAKLQLAAATAMEPDLTASRKLPGPLRVLFEEGREKLMDGLRKAGLPE